MKKLYYLSILFLFSCTTHKVKNFEPNPTHKICDTVYIKPDSAKGVIKWFSVIVGKDTIYYYGIEKENGKRIISSDKDIFTKDHNQLSH